MSVAMPGLAAPKPDKVNRPILVMVVGAKAPGLERYAADELCGYLEKLVGIQTAPIEKIPDGVDTIFLIGCPETNAAILRTLGVGSGTRALWPACRQNAAAARLSEKTTWPWRRAAPS